MTADATAETKWWSDPRTATRFTFVPALVALALGGYELSLPHVLFGVTGYDDGVWFGSAVALAHGVLPYRDYAFVAPPGIAELLWPIGLLSRVTGTDTAFAVARLVTAAVVGLEAFLAAWALRHRGVVASQVAGFALVLAPSALAADYSVMLEPYLNACCLLGIVLALPGGRFAGPRRLVAAGVAFGVAGAVKPWAIVPAAVLALVALPEVRRRVVPFVAGTAAGFFVPTLPLALLAPGAFWRDVVTSQLTRQAGGRLHSFGYRMGELTGLGRSLGLTVTPWLAVGVCTVVLLGCAAVIGVAVLRGRSSALDLFAFVATVATLVAVVVEPTYYTHYNDFVAPYFALLVGSVAPYLTASVALGDGRRSPGGIARGALAGLALVAVVLVGLDVAHDRDWAATAARDRGTAIAAAVPLGACVLSDNPSLLLTADRFLTANGRCPFLLDSFGTWLAVDPRNLPGDHRPPPPALVALWRGLFAGADYVVLDAQHTFRVPWTPALDRAFQADFRRLPLPPADLPVYVRRS